MQTWMLYFILVSWERWRYYVASNNVQTISAYVGYIFNVSFVVDGKTNFPNWIYWDNGTLIGLPLKSNVGEKLYISNTNGQEIIITVIYPSPWWTRLTNLDENNMNNFDFQMFVTAFIVDQESFVLLSIKDKVKFVAQLRKVMNIKKPICVMPLYSVYNSISIVTKSASSVPSKSSLTLLWNIGKDYIFNSSLKSLQNFENKFSNGSVEINKIVILQWFVGFLRQQRKLSRIYYRRSANNPEHFSLIEGSGFWQMKKANQFVRRTKDNSSISKPHVSNDTFSSSRPYIAVPLLPIKMHALQIMNYVIPESAFKDKEFKSLLKIKVYSKNNRIVTNDSSKWISYSQNDQNIRINPKLTDIGETMLKVCAYNIQNAFICQNLSISVSTPPPQSRQIYVPKAQKDYIIRYTMPLAWFKRFGVRKTEDLQIVNATGNSPFDWSENGNLEILDIASIEGKLIEFNLMMLIKNESKISVHLTLAVVAINRQKMTTGPLYRSVLKFHGGNTFERRTVYNLTDIWKLLKELENYISKILMIFKIKIQIFSPIKSPVFFDKVQGNKDSLLIFDWFFYNEIPTPSFCNHPKINVIHQELLFQTFGSFNMVNISILENYFGGVCSINIELYPVTKESSDVQEMIPNTTPSIGDMKIAAEYEIINKIYPNFQYSNFTVTAGLPFQSYIFRPKVTDQAAIKEMRLEASSDVETEPWIALSVSNDFLYGLPLEKHVRESAYKFRFIIKLINSQTQFKVTFQVNVVNYDRTSVSLNHKIKLSVKTINIKIDMQYRWKLVTQLDKYVRDNCHGANDCGKDLVLWDVDSIQDTENPASSSSVSIEISFLSLLSKNIPYCPKLNLIHLYEKFINTVLTNKETVPNPTIKYLFSNAGLGEIIGCQIILMGICKGLKLQTPDMGQITVYAMIPFYHSLQKFRIFYNSSVKFSVNAGHPTIDKMMYHEWISVNEDSTALVGLALHQNARVDPYLIELTVHSQIIRQIISPRIAVQVRNLKDHHLFVPFFQQPNHQIIFNIHPMMKTSPIRNLLHFKHLFSTFTDRYFRHDCIKNDYMSSGLALPPCGSNLVYKSIVISENMDMVTFKFSLIRELSFVKQDSSQQMALNGFEKFCPKEQLAKIERNLIGDSGFSNKQGILPNVDDYFYKSHLGKVVDIKFEYLGACSHYQLSNGPRKEVADESVLKVSPTNLRKVNDDSRQMFLMATIVPTCSFIIISLCVGLMVACCLQKRNQKFMRSINSHRSSAEFMMRGGTSPIILATEYQHPYMPPSRPLILPHEKPPVSPPDYIAENNSVLINDEEA